MHANLHLVQRTGLGGIAITCQSECDFRLSQDGKATQSLNGGFHSENLTDRWKKYGVDHLKRRGRCCSLVEPLHVSWSECGRERLGGCVHSDPRSPPFTAGCSVSNVCFSHLMLGLYLCYRKLLYLMSYTVTMHTLELGAVHLKKKRSYLAQQERERDSYSSMSRSVTKHGAGPIQKLAISHQSALLF